jgi:hypothetical protein
MKKIFATIILSVLFGIIASFIASYLWWELHFSRMVPQIEEITLKEGAVSIKPKREMVDVHVRGVILGNVINPEETWRFFYDERPTIEIPVTKCTVPLSAEYFYSISHVGERGKPSDTRSRLRLDDEKFLKNLLKGLKNYGKAANLKDKIHKVMAGNENLSISDLLEVFDFFRIEVIGSHEKTGLRAYFSEKFPKDRR